MTDCGVDPHVTLTTLRPPVPPLSSPATPDPIAWPPSLSGRAQRRLPLAPSPVAPPPPGEGRDYKILRPLFRAPDSWPSEEDLRRKVKALAKERRSSAKVAYHQAGPVVKRSREEVELDEAVLLADTISSRDTPKARPTVKSRENLCDDLKPTSTNDPIFSVNTPKVATVKKSRVVES